MRCQNSTDANRRCNRTASKIAIVKDVIEKQSKFWICDDCLASLTKSLGNNHVVLILLGSLIISCIITLYTAVINYYACIYGFTATRSC